MGHRLPLRLVEPLQEIGDALLGGGVGRHPTRIGRELDDQSVCGRRAKP
jgi:hypothetical protein